MLSEILGAGSKSAMEDDSERKYPYTTSIVADGRRKLHTTYKDGEEMVEEFDLNTNQLLLRRRRRQTILGGSGEWEIEIGGEVKPFNPFNELLAPSSVNVSTCCSEKLIIKAHLLEKGHTSVLPVENQKLLLSKGYLPGKQ